MSPTDKVPEFDVGPLVMCPGCGKTHRERTTCYTTGCSRPAVEEIAALEAKCAALVSERDDYRDTAFAMAAAAHGIDSRTATPEQIAMMETEGRAAGDTKAGDSVRRLYARALQAEADRDAMRERAERAEAESERLRDHVWFCDTISYLMRPLTNKFRCGPTWALTWLLEREAVMREVAAVRDAPQEVIDKLTVHAPRDSSVSEAERKFAEACESCERLYDVDEMPSGADLASIENAEDRRRDSWRALLAARAGSKKEG